MKARILVVDDEPNIREVVEQYLRREGYDTIAAADGEEAVARAADADLVVLDLMLPRLDGNVVSRRIRTTRDVPIIVLAGQGAQPDRRSGPGVGADEAVPEPD